MQQLLENLLCMHATEKKKLYLYIQSIMHIFIGTLLSSIVKGALIKDCENVLKAQSHIKVLWSKLRTSKVD